MTCRRRRQQLPATCSSPTLASGVRPRSTTLSHATGVPSTDGLRQRGRHRLPARCGCGRRRFLLFGTTPGFEPHRTGARCHAFRSSTNMLTQPPLRTVGLSSTRGTSRSPSSWRRVRMWRMPPRLSATITSMCCSTSPAVPRPCDADLAPRGLLLCDFANHFPQYYADHISESGCFHPEIHRDEAELPALPADLTSDNPCADVIKISGSPNCMDIYNIYIFGLRLAAPATCGPDSVLPFATTRDTHWHWPRRGTRR